MNFCEYVRGQIWPPDVKKWVWWARKRVFTLILGTLGVYNLSSWTPIEMNFSPEITILEMSALDKFQAHIIPRTFFIGKNFFGVEFFSSFFLRFPIFDPFPDDSDQKRLYRWKEDFQLLITLFGIFSIRLNIFRARAPQSWAIGQKPSKKMFPDFFSHSKNQPILFNLVSNES